MADHAGKPGFLLFLVDRLGIRPSIGKRYFHLHMLAGIHAGNRLFRMHLRRRGEDDGFDARLRDGFVQFGGDVGNAVFIGNFLRLFQAPADDGYHFVAVDPGNAIQVLLTECAGPGESYFHFVSSKIIIVTLKRGFPK